MFLTWNENKHNKLEFGLIIGILVLISYLLFLLSGLANGFLMKMMLIQTFILALIGTLIGLILTWLTNLVLPKAVPVQFDIKTLIIFGFVLILTSFVGSLFSVLSIRKIDPLKIIG